MTFIVTYIRRERRKWGLTQREVARLIGVTSSAHVSALERGITRPSAEVLLALQMLFGMTAAQLFPQVVQRAQAKVMTEAAAMLDDPIPTMSLRTQRKHTLLRQIPSRAIMS